MPPPQPVTSPAERLVADLLTLLDSTSDFPESRQIVARNLVANLKDFILETAAEAVDAAAE